MSMIGKTLGDFEYTALVGKGGMGEVYSAKDQKLGRDPPRFETRQHQGNSRWKSQGFGLRSCEGVSGRFGGYESVQFANAERCSNAARHNSRHCRLGVKVT